MKYRFPDGIARDSINRFPFSLDRYYQLKDDPKAGIISIDDFERTKLQTLNGKPINWLVVFRSLKTGNIQKSTFASFQRLFKIYNP